jgi:hypothetical protein
VRTKKVQSGSTLTLETVDPRDSERDETAERFSETHGGVALQSMVESIMPTSAHQFEQLCETALAEAGPLSPAARDSIIEGLRIRQAHSSEYVVYVDEYRLQGDVWRMSRRVLAHDASHERIQVVVSSLSADDRANVRVDFADPLEGDLEIPDELSRR